MMGHTRPQTLDLHASWISQDDECGVSEYQYAIGTSPTDPGSGYTAAWKSAGVNVGATETGLDLENGQTYYFYVKAKNRVGLDSSVGVSDGIEISTDSIAIEQIAFHKATFLSQYTEKAHSYPCQLLAEDDNGGTMFVFVRNNTDSEQTLSDFSINGTDCATLRNSGVLKWWRIFPTTIAPGEVATIWTKHGDAPLQEQSHVSVVVRTTDSGVLDSSGTQLTTPALRIGSIIPSQDMKTICVYVRNRDSVQLHGQPRISERLC